MADGEYIIVVDENDNPIGNKLRSEITKDDIYRASALWVTNSAGDILMAQRSFEKRYDPGKWQPAVAGTVEVGETYESNIIKETAEEIGVENITPKKVYKLRAYGKNNTFFCQGFTAMIDLSIKDFTIEQGAVLQVKWFERDELGHLLTTKPEMFTPLLERAFKELT